MPRPPRLLVMAPAGESREVQLTVFPFRIGRQSENELVLRDGRISRLQAQIFAAGDVLMLEDCGSRNGTEVNGKPLTGPCPLQARDSIDFGIPDTYRLIYLGSDATLDELIDLVGKPEETAPGTQDLHHLSILLEVARTMSSRLALEDALSAVVDAAIRLTHTDRGALLLGDSTSGFKASVARDAHGKTIPTEELRISRSILERVAPTHRELIVRNPGVDSKSAPGASVLSLALETVVALPIERQSTIAAADNTMVAQDRGLLGVLYLDSHSPSIVFSETDRDILRALAREASTVIENTQLFATARAKARLDHEIEIASQIQRRLFPDSLPHTPHFTLEAFTLACHQVGGDCFEVVELGGNRYGFLLGDVSGKGIAASLLATLLQGVFYTVAGLDLPLPEILGRVNQYLYARSEASHYATIFYGVLDPSGDFQYINAGQPSPLLRSASGNLAELPSTNFPVGMFPRAEFTPAHTKLQPGDLLIVSSDGVTDSANPAGETFGDERLQDLARSTAGASAANLASAVRDALHAFTRGAQQADDITFMALEYKGNANSPAAKTNSN